MTFPPLLAAHILAASDEDPSPRLPPLPQFLVLALDFIYLILLNEQIRDVSTRRNSRLIPHPRRVEKVSCVGERRVCAD